MRRLRGSMVALGLLGVTGWVALAQPQGKPSASTSAGAIATVGSRRVERASFEPQAKQTLSEFERQRGSSPGADVSLILRRQVLEHMIRENLLILEAKRRKIPISDADVEAEFKKHPFFNPSGTFDQRRFEMAKAANSAEYRTTLAQLREQMAGRKLAQRLETDFTPDPAELKTRVERRLSRADVEYLAIRGGDISGACPEPREADVLAYYQAHARDYQRSERAVISVILVPRGSRPDGEKRARATADSVIDQLRSGAAFEALGPTVGDLRSGVTVTPQSFPDYWQGQAKVNAAVFKQAPGTVLSEPVPGRDGWLVVRADDVRPAGVAALREVAPEIRGLLRAQAKRGMADADLRAIYETRKSMLKTTGYRARYATIETLSVRPGEPSSADLDRYYRAHLADYSHYDPTLGSVHVAPLAEVRDEVRVRWLSDRRQDLTRVTAEKLRDAWRQGRRDRALEQQTTGVRDRGPVPPGAPFDDTPAGHEVTDSLVARQGALGAGLAPFGGGFLVFHFYETVPNYIPTFEDFRPKIESEAQERLAQQDEDAAHRLFDQNPGRYAGGRVVHFGEITVELLDPVRVPLTRKEVEQFHLDHMDRYSAPQEIRCRHILVSPVDDGPAADMAARHKAEDLLRRIRAGEDIADLAKQYSDDPPTRKTGGDLGFFGRGVMLDAFERAAFALKPGEVSDLVRTEAGYHIIKMIDQVPLQADPLPMVYTNVGADAAREKAVRIAAARADSILRSSRTPAQARAIAKTLHLEVGMRELRQSDVDRMPSDTRSFGLELMGLAPGTMYPRTRTIKGVGTSVMWVDSITPDRKPEWDEVRARVIGDYQAAAARRALLAKRAELDSLEAHGWSFDSLATLWGGVERAQGVVPGKGLPGLRGGAVVDSLVFGGKNRPALATGGLSGWNEIVGNFVRLRLVDVKRPTRENVTARVDAERRYEVEHQLEAYFAELEQSYPVRILDPDLRTIDLPPVPEPGTR